MLVQRFTVLMRSLRASFLVRTIVVLMFALLMGEQAVLHACPLHEGATGTGHGQDVKDVKDVTSAHAAPAAHDSHHAQHAVLESEVLAPEARSLEVVAPEALLSQALSSDEPSSHDGESHHTGCNCLGMCAAAATVAAPIVAVVVVPAPEVVVRESRSTTYESPSYQPRATHRLPFGIGPPRLT